MALLKSLLHNRNVILLLALATGLFIPFAVPVTRHLVLPALAMTMALSTMLIGNDIFRAPRLLFFPVVFGILMNYILLGNVLIGLSSLLIRNEAIWTGFVLVAAVPPAIAIIPFSGILRGNNSLSLFGTVGAHLGALAIMPMIVLVLLGTASFPPYKILLVLLFLIIIPLAASHPSIRRCAKDRIDPYRGTATNWSFFVVLYTMVGLNRDLILSRGSGFILLPIAAVLIGTTFVLGFLIDWVGGLFHIPRETRTSLVLLGTLKNQAIAGGLAITFFSQEAALPAAVSSLVMIAYFALLDFKKRWD